MPPSSARLRLRADIQAAGQATIPFIPRIGKGDVQDEFVFIFAHPQIPTGEVEIRVMPQDASAYPRDNYYLVYTNADVSPKISGTLDDAMALTKGMTITDLLNTLSRRLCACLDSVGGGPGEDDNDNGDDDVLTGANSFEISDVGDSDDSLEYSDDDDDDGFGIDSDFRNTSQTKVPNTRYQDISQDFTAVRNAGFKIGKICGVDYMSAHTVLSISIKAGKLGLSEETYVSWNLEPSDYIVLLLKYDDQYVSFEDAMKRPVGQIPIAFKLRKCSNYRPTFAEAVAAFSPNLLNSNSKQSIPELASDGRSPVGGNSLFRFSVGDSIDSFFETGFLSMMKIRRAENVSWDDARRIHSQLTIASRDTESITMPTLAPNPMDSNTTDINLPPILIDDHLSSKGPVSLPLVAMQFALRYLVKCTDYCMICHDRMTGNLQALKPYVCGNPLCLYQYMNVGLGPSIDEEIINQEYVVDLLISFCYASLQRAPNGHTRLREFPSGLNLQVPRVRKYENGIKGPIDINIDRHGTLIEPIEVEVTWPQRKARVSDQFHPNCSGLREDRWVVIHTEHKHQGNPAKPPLNIFHYAYIEKKVGSDLDLVLASRHPVPMSLAAYEEMRTWCWDGVGRTTGHLVFCDQSLDDLQNDEDKAFSLNLLLSTLPPVKEMREYLMGDKTRQLATWSRIPPAAMKLLRWIIASNRSYIVQLDERLGTEVNSSDVGTKKLGRSEEKISGVDGWVQFRFAQGSPEKEALFFDALREVDSSHRTILAWHGSAVGNWHSIIREGLNFKVMTNGRAYGHGVYFSRSFEYSISYSRPRTEPELLSWPQSALQITQAISLNELVNLPHKFQHSVSCYVVDNLHWIQCRYLLVRPANENIAPLCPERAIGDSAQEFKQDPHYAITGPSYKKTFVPKVAIPWVQPQQASTSLGPDGLAGDDTDDEDADDIDFLTHIDVDGTQPHTTNPGPPVTGAPSSLTDFRPGHLDFSTLPRFDFPSYATKPAQQTIQRELQKLEKIQSTTPPHELGWYIDFDKIDNMFQLIVELHSFDPSLPLAQDMKAAGITSVVLEIRFLRGFPLSPPFVRVIQPRFLPFANGGGGHVTAGGAMCMELLTNTGWSPANNMESVLLQVRLAMCGLEPRPARLEKVKDGFRQYGLSEAVDAYVRAARIHGWEVPAELKEVQH